MNRLNRRSRANFQSSGNETREAKRRMPIWAWLIIGLLVFIVAVILSPIFAAIFLVALITGIVSLTRNSPTWLRLRSRKAAGWVTAISAAGFLITAGITNAALVAGPEKRPVTAEAAPSGIVSTASPQPTPSTTPTPAETPIEVRSVIDGDTIDTNAGKVRLIGIDAPEAGSWGYDQATAELASFLAPGGVTLVAASERDDVDQYGRKLRYVKLNGQDAGSHMLSTGWAVARYDGRDGYGTHPLQATYITLDDASEMPTEPQPAPAAPEQPPAPAEPAPVQPEPAPANPAPAEPEPDAPTTDPQFGTCGEANDNGYGNYRQGVDPEYGWYRDRDKDGVVCEF